MTLPTKSSPTCSAMYKPKLPYSSYNCRFFSSLKIHNISKDDHIRDVIPEDAVGLIDLLEHLLGLCIVRVLIWVIFQCKPPVLLFDIDSSGGLRDVQQLV